MTAMYGARFADFWAGAKLTQVKAMWGDALAPYPLDVVRDALKACLDLHPYPPTLPQFLAVVRAQRGAQRAALTHWPAPGVPMPPAIRTQLAGFLKGHTWPKP
jgi:hypothetical protein